MKFSNNRFKQVLVCLVKKNNEYRLADVSAGITYYLLLSIGPFLILAFSLLSYFLAGNVDIVISTAERVYEDAGLIINPVLEYLDSTNSSAFAIIGGLATLYSSSKASRRLIRAFHTIFEIERKNSILTQLFFIVYSMLFTLALLLSLVIFFVFFINGDPIVMLVDFLFNFKLDSLFLWTFVRNFVPLIYLFIFLFLIFNLLPNFGKGRRVKTREALMGSAFVTMGWLLGSELFRFYIQKLDQNNLMYGALGSIMVLMLWFYILVYTMLLGAALVSSYIEVRDKNKIENT